MRTINPLGHAAIVATVLVVGLLAAVRVLLAAPPVHGVQAFAGVVLFVGLVAVLLDRHLGDCDAAVRARNARALTTWTTVTA